MKVADAWRWREAPQLAVQAPTLRTDENLQSRRTLSNTMAENEGKKVKVKNSTIIDVLFSSSSSSSCIYTGSRFHLRF